jgi:hypothetical protein
MAALASIIIEVDDSAAVGALNRVKTEAAAIGPALQPVQRISEQTFNSIEGGALRAREAAALLGEEFGVKVPRALRGVLAESAGIGPALSVAFSGLAVIGFIEIAERAGNAVAAYVDKLMGWSEQAKKTMDSQTALNKVVTDSIDKIDKLDRAFRLIGKEGVALFSEKLKMTTEDVDFAKKRVAELTAELQKWEAVKQSVAGKVTFSGITGTVSGVAGTMSAGQIADVHTLEEAQANIDRITPTLATVLASLRVLAPESRNAGAALDAEVGKKGAEAAKKLATATEEASKRLDEMTAAANKAGLTGEARITADAQFQIDKAKEIYSKQPTLAAGASAAVTAIEAAAMRERIKLLTDEVDKKFKLDEKADEEELQAAHAQAEKLRRMEDETLNLDKAAAVAMAPPWERAQAAILASYQERMDKVRQMLATGDLDEAHAARQAADAWNVAFAQMRDNLANQMQSLFDDITSGNIGKAFKKMFEQVVFQMVATWVLGLKGMRSASAGAMGGGSGGILGALFGLGGGGGGGQGGISSIPGVITNFGGGGTLGGLDNLPVFSGGAEAAGAFGLLGLGLSAGQGSGVAGAVLPAGAASAGAAGAVSNAAGLAGVLTNIFPHGLSIGGMTLSGSALATLGLGLGVFGEQTILKGGFGNALLGIGSDFLAGAGIGFAIGGPFGAGIGALIGTIVGGITAIFGAIFGQHKGDKARIQVMEPLIAQIKVIKDSYDVFQTNYNTGVSELETLRTSAIANLQKIGGRQVSGNTASTNRLVDDAETYLKTTEAERARRTQINFGAPQFQGGGLVGPGGGAVHAGEYVMRSEAVSQIGVGNLSRMNAGGGGGADVHLHFNVNAIDAASFREFLDRGGMVEIAKGWRRGVNQGAW